MTIRIKIALIVTAFFIAVAALILSLQFFKLSGEIKDEISDHLFNRVSEEAANLDELIAARKNVIADAGKALPTGIADKPAELQKYIEGRKVLLGLFDSVYVASTKGDIVAYAPANPRALGTNLLNRAYFQQVLATGKPQISQPLMGSINRVPIVTMVAPVLDPQGEAVLVMGGVLQLLKPNILGKITEEKAGKTGYFFLFTKDGMLVEHPKKDLILTFVNTNTDPVSVKAMNGFEGTEEGVNAYGLHALFSFKGLNSTNWVLGAALPVEEAFEAVFRTEREMAWILAGATLLLGPLVWFVMLRLTLPLGVLHKTIRAIRQNPETLEQVPVSSNDEIGELAESFNQMVLELKERQTQRWVAEEKLSGIMGAINQVVWSISASTFELLYLNPAAEKVYGRPVADFYKNPNLWLEIIHPEDQKRVKGMLPDLRLQRAMTIEYRIIRADGEVRWLEDHAHAVYDVQGSVVRFDGLATDITERKKADEAIRNSERQFRALIENSHEAITVTDASTKRLYVSQTVERVLGYSPEDYIKGTISEITHPEDIPVVRGLFQEVNANPHKPTHITFRVRHKDGSWRWIESTGTNCFDVPNLGGIVINYRDVTERKEQEEKIARLTRIYAVLSGINSAIVRIRDRQQLFDEACGIAAEKGQFGMAWIGLLEPDSTTVRPVAWRGLGEVQLRNFRSTSNDTPEGQGTIGTAMREKRAVFCNDLTADLNVGVGRREAIKLGYHSLVSLPLIVENAAIGVLALYAKEPNFFDEEEMKLLVGLADDISFALEYIEKEEKLQYLAYYDPLTGLPNRTLCHDRLEQAIAQAHRHNYRVAVGCLDLDQLKFVNDSLGHSAGDEMLKTVADRLKACVRENDTVARIGGDEFVLIFPELPTPETSIRIVKRITDAIPRDPRILETLQRILNDLATPVTLAGREFSITCSVGVGLYPEDGQDTETLLKNADAAMHRAKEQGRNNFQFYMEEMNAGANERLSLQAMLGRALEREEYLLYYQPIIDLKDGHLSGIEALIRWNNPEMGLVQPFKFIPILEETGMIIDVGKWVMEKAVSDHARCLAEHPDFPRIAVNISQVQLHNEKFVETIKKAVEKSANAGAGLDFEITESLIMKDVEATISKLRAIREMGIGIAIDDFGTGYSSLNYLAKLPIDALKVDRTFTMNIGNRHEDLTIVSSIISLAHSLNLRVIAEGVETLEQLKLLTLLKCEEAQGYLIGRPIPMDELLEWKARFSFEAIKTDQRGSGATT